MIKQILSIILLSIVTLVSCKEKKQTNKKVETENVSNIIKSEATNNNGETLFMLFDNKKDIVTVTFNEEKQILPSARPVSGIWYKNGHYELSG